MPDIADYHFEGSLHDDPKRRLSLLTAKLGRRQVSAIVLTLVVAIMLPVTLIAVKQQQNFRQRAATMPVTSPVTATPGIMVKQTWRTNSASLEADEFKLIADGKNFYANTSIAVHSDPSNFTIPDYTTLETIWNENGVEMRIYFYFQLDSNNMWRLTEIRSYNGKAPGEWLIYSPYDANGNPVQHFLGQTYQTETAVWTSKASTAGSGTLYIKNLKLQAFLDRLPTSTPMLTPTSVPTSTPTAVPTSTPKLTPTSTPHVTATPTPWWNPTATSTPRPTATPTTIVGSVTSGKISVSPATAKVSVRAGYYQGATAFTVKNISGKPSFWTTASIQFTDRNARYITISGALWVTKQGAPVEIKAMSAGAVSGVYGGTVTIKNGVGGELKLPIQVTVTK